MTTSKQQDVKVKPHTDNELAGFIEALDAWFLAKANTLNLIQAKQAMPLDKATKQLGSYIQPLLCLDE